MTDNVVDIAVWRDPDTKVERYLGHNALQVRDWLRRMHYKPGWSWSVEDMGYEVAVRVHVDAIDSLTLEHNVSILHRRVVYPRIDTFEEFTHWWRQTLHDIELHESDEFIRVDGVRMFDPHERGR